MNKTAAASDELRKEYRRQYNERKREECQGYRRRYWERQVDHLERELVAANENDLAKRIRTATGDDLTQAIKEALTRVSTLPSAFTGKR